MSGKDGLPFPKWVLLFSALQCAFGLSLAFRHGDWFMAGFCVGFGLASAFTALMAWASPVGRSYRR